MVLRTIIGVVIVVGASVGAAWGLKKYVTESPRFMIRTVTVEGTRSLSPDEVARVGGITVGSNIFALEIDGAKNKIEQHPYVASATVSRKLPNLVSVRVTEREAGGIVAVGDELFLATHDGLLFKPLEATDEHDFPIITGIAEAQVTNDRKGAELNVRRAMEIVRVVGATAFGRRYPLEEVHLEKDGQMSIVVGAEGMVIHLGAAPYQGKIEQAERVLAEIQKRKVKVSVIHLDNETSPERVVVRMR